MGRKFGTSFSWKRASGLSSAKRNISRSTGIPLTRSGRRQKAGRELGCLITLIVAASAVLLSAGALLAAMIARGR